MSYHLSKSIGFLIVPLALSWSQLVAAQVPEAGAFNDACTDAQDIGEFHDSGALIVDGSLDTPPEVPDVDFYRLSATAGETLEVNLKGINGGGGTLADPILGWFDSGCELVAFNDDAFTTDSRLAVEVPLDGIVILAVAACCDSDFTGVDGPGGSYTLSIARPTPGATIAGVLVNGDTGEGLAGNGEPFATVTLHSCYPSAVNCDVFVSSASTDADGRFLFETDFLGLSLQGRQYRISADSNLTRAEEFGPFTVAEDENLDVGNLELEPFDVFVSDVRPCTALTSEGGHCRYSVTVNNSTDSRLRGAVWSIVDAEETGSDLGYSTFPASLVRGRTSAHVKSVSLKPNARQHLRFGFHVPPGIEEGASLCARLFVGNQPYPRIDTITEANLFCTEIGSGNDPAHP